MERRRLFVALALAAACLLLYSPVAHFDFLNYDDLGYVTDNAPVRGGFTAAGIVWAFTTIDHFYWQPVTWLSHMLDCQWFGLNPGPHHLHNVVLHTLNAVLVFAIFLRLTGALWRSAMLAAVFALHPLRIESVAWVAERKDTLSAFWFLIALWCYLRYVRRPSRPRYYLVLVLFALGLMSKPMVMMLPVMLLLLDYWPLRRKALAEKIPFFGFAAMSLIITWLGTHRLEAINWGATTSLTERLANTTVSYVKYLKMMVWPRPLALLYPFRLSIPLWEVLACAALLLAITGVVLRLREERPYLFVGWFWFVAGLLPASGLVQVGRQGMGDRFTYLPMIGLAFAVIWTAADLLAEPAISELHSRIGKPLADARGSDQRHDRQGVVFAKYATATEKACTKRPALAAAISALTLAALAGLTWLQLPVWRDSVAVFTNTLAVTGTNTSAEYHLAGALDARGRFDEALPHHAESVRLEPNYFIAQYSYGVALERYGETQAAIDHLRLALRYFPDYPDARQHLAANLLRLGRTEEAAAVLDPSKASGLKLKEER